MIRMLYINMYYEHFIFALLVLVLYIPSIVVFMIVSILKVQRIEY